MEILATETDWLEFFVLLLFFGGIAFLAIVTLVTVVHDLLRGRGSKGDIPGAIMCLALASVFGLATYEVVDNGPDKTFEAKVTDYNEIYENGYVIVDHRDDIVVIEKEDES